MSNPSNLITTFLPPATAFRPVEGRKYTLTHSDTSGQLFLTIGSEYNYGSTNQSFRDEVMAEWVHQLGEYSLLGRVYVSGGEFDKNYSKIRFAIFQKELNLALQAMVFGDQAFYTNFPWLLDAPIYIRFESVYPEFNQVLYYGTPRNFLLSNNMKEPIQ
ncbi:staygreen family protein [Neobacillus dielmonensis]|uniref:staygreen family protein n=1 Tax=Neobacillus dielmonensis TaxID=1347369 RepID=UPI0005AAE15F|nr:staygreen family protein [Neobacillus dielmonensis]